MANPNRVEKVHFFTYDFTGGIGSYVFDGLYVLSALMTSNVASSAGGTTVLGSLVLPQRSFLVKVSVYAAVITASATGDDLMHLIVGPNALTGLTWPGTTGTVTAAGSVGVAGNVVSKNPFDLTKGGSGAAGPSVQNYVPDTPQAMYDTGQTLDISIKTTNNGGITQPIIVSCLFAVADAHPDIRTANPATDF